MLSVSQSRHEEMSPSGHLLHNRLAALVAVAMLIATLVIAGCGQTTTVVGSLGPRTAAGPTATVWPPPTPTDVAPHGAALAWMPATLPPGNVFGEPMGYETQDSLSGLYIDPSDGNTAYACTAPLTTQEFARASVWVSHDRARHWRQLAPLPAPPQTAGTICQLFLDAADSSIMVVAVSSHRPKDFMGAPTQWAVNFFTDFVTFDGGAHWQLFRGPEPVVLRWLATYHGTTLALLETGSGNVNLWSSADQMQTWQELKQAPYYRQPPFGQPSYGQPSINPVTGDMLVVGQTSSDQVQLYVSADLGQHWTSLPTPLDSTTMNPLDSTTEPIVSPPAAGQPWRICGFATTSVSISSSGVTLMCSMDGGRTWTSPPQLELTAFGNVGPFTQVASEFAVGSDGAVLAQIGASQWGNLVPQGLYRLAPASNRWQSIGPQAGDEYDTADVPGAGILWEMNGGTPLLFPDATT